MVEYIERRKSVDAIADTMAKGFVEDRFILPQELQDLQDELEMLPAADVAPVVHGRWMPPVDGKYGCLCSACKKQSDNGSDYCPNCGAKMDLSDGKA